MCIKHGNVFSKKIFVLFPFYLDIYICLDYEEWLLYQQVNYLA